ncbi:MAG: hypothetical protein ACK5IQ_06755 [Bacteroidales bacterium]
MSNEELGQIVTGNYSSIKEHSIKSISLVHNGVQICKVDHSFEKHCLIKTESFQPDYGSPYPDRVHTYYYNNIGNLVSIDSVLFLSCDKNNKVQSVRLEWFYDLSFFKEKYHLRLESIVNGEEGDTTQLLNTAQIYDEFGKMVSLLKNCFWNETDTNKVSYFDELKHINIGYPNEEIINTRKYANGTVVTEKKRVMLEQLDGNSYFVTNYDSIYYSGHERLRYKNSYKQIYDSLLHGRMLRYRDISTKKGLRSLERDCANGDCHSIWIFSPSVLPLFIYRIRSNYEVLPYKIHRFSEYCNDLNYREFSDDSNCEQYLGNAIEQQQPIRVFSDYLNENDNYHVDIVFDNGESQRYEMNELLGIDRNLHRYVFTLEFELGLDYYYAPIERIEKSKENLEKLNIKSK